MSDARRYRPPAASYRVQLSAAFGFAAAAAAVPYLDRLGISHLYVSPITAAMPGSAHGYDVRDHGQVNPELGGLQGLYDLHAALAGRDMGLIVDIVPNHVGVGAGNPWWEDVLRFGPESRYAGYFDIDWNAQPQLSSGVLVYPVLGQSFGAALEAGELQLGLQDGEIVVRYFDHALPISPSTYPDITGLPPASLASPLADAAALPAFIEVIDGLGRADTPAAEQLLLRWRELVAGERAIREFVEGQLAAVNGTPGDPASFDRLEALLRRQHYRLSNWRVSGEEVNYRRFFDVNSLAGIRIERDDVFQEVHHLLFQLVARGIVTGVRVDHVDGLYDPADYLVRLRAGLDEAMRDADGRHIPIYVEKILEGDEELPPEWPVDGTTGYEFAARVDQLLVQPAGAALDRAYAEFVGSRPRFSATAYEARLEVASELFAGEVNVLAIQLHRLARRQRRWSDVTLRALRRAIERVLASFPVYRTYLGHGSDGAGGRTQVEAALRLARGRDDSLSDDALAFLGEVLLLEGDLDEGERALRTHFRRHFQQVSGPVMAKGLEDTTFFRYNRLLSLNEVGGDPSRVGLDAALFHGWLQQRALRWPNAMLASSTHDTKRDEDVRARIDVLSELGNEWRREVLAWQRLNARHKREVAGEAAPAANDEYYLYQTLVGAWPEGGLRDAFRERVQAHMVKALREGKVETSWSRPNDEYERACHDFIERVLDPRGAKAFLRRLERLVARIRPAAAANALAGLALKATSPGFPDFYQGVEGVPLSLTDPDNRRPVDFDALDALLTRAAGEAPLGLLDPWTKVWLTRRLLDARARYAATWASGAYQPLRVEGALAGHVFAFARIGPDATVVTAIARHVLRLAEPDGIPPDRWQDTAVALPEGVRWCDLLVGRTFDDGGTSIRASELFAHLPVALVAAEAGAHAG